MKRLIRWIGVTIMAAAALTMVMADMVLAAPRQDLTVHFDLFSPQGVTCAVEAPGASVRQGRDILGKPLIRILGDAAGAAITCTGPDGARYRLDAQARAPFSPALATWVTVVFRPGQARMLTITESGRKTVHDTNSFVRLD